ncbi:MAG: hypothetical protein ACRBDL_01640 [Alphaproteobacteria bacterium]
MAEDTKEEKAPSSGKTGLIQFDRNLVINPLNRLPHFDNGSAKAYDAFDQQVKNKKYIALVSGVEVLPRWSSVAAYDALADTSFIRMERSGIVKWAPDGREKHVVIYSTGVGEALVPEGSISTSNWRHPDILSLFIQPMARILREMSDKNFHHGSIRPSNIFHGSLSKDKPIILGDCLSVQPSSTQPVEFLPIEKAMTDPMGRGNGSLTDDIYAFGVSLVFFLRKSDEFSSLSDLEIVRKKIEYGSYAALVGGERFQASFLELLRGILHDDAALRWKVDDIFSWLDGTRLTPPPSIKRKKANRPFNFLGRKYLFADTLALELHQNPNDVASVVDDGSLARWINKSIDDISLQERYEKVIDRVANAGGSADNKDYLVAQLRMALNPALPIAYNGHSFTYDGIGGVLAHTLSTGEDVAFVKDVLRLNLCDHALASAKMSQAELMAYLKTLDTCRASLRQNKIGYGIERCAYLLFREAPCFSEKLKNHFVSGYAQALVAFEELCKKGGQSAVFFDSHLMAFFTVVNSSVMERCVYDITSKERGRQVQGNLRFFSVMQQRAGSFKAPDVAHVFLESLSGAVKLFKNRTKRKEVMQGLEDAAKDGDLVTMSSLLDDERSLALDSKGFQLAAYEFNMLQNEYNEYNRRLSNKKTYGAVNGHDAASIVAWIVATAINLMVVLAYLSGYKVF